MSGAHTFKHDPGLQKTVLGGTNKLKQERDRAYLFNLVLALLLALSIIANVVLAKIHTVIPVVTSIDANGHVVRQQVVSKETISGLASFVENQVFNFITACNTFDPAWRQYYADMCRLHSTQAVARQYELEIGNENPDNPYYTLAKGGRRYPKITAINPIEDNAYQVEFQSITERPGSGNAVKVEYYTALVRNTFTFQPLALGDRWENPLGFAATSYSKNLKLSGQ